MNLDVIIWMIKTVPKKEGLKSVDEMKLAFILEGLHGINSGASVLV